MINETEYADDPDTFEYFNMQGMKINVESKGFKCVVDFLESSPPEQMMMVKEYVWEQIPENFEAIVQVHAKHRDHIGSAMTVYCFIKICRQKCLKQNKPSIVYELDILSKANLGTWEGYGCFKEDLALYLSSYERAAGLDTAKQTRRL